MAILNPLDINKQDNSLDKLYQELARLKQGSITPTVYKTVFNDISAELSACSTDERSYIECDESYKQANDNYMQQFNAFLLEAMGSQFMASPYAKSAEDVLIVVRKCRDSYKDVTAKTLTTIKEENEILRKEIEALKQKTVNGGTNVAG